MSTPVRFALYAALMGLLVGVIDTARADARENRYAAVIDRVETLYLWRDDLDFESVLKSVARRLEREVEWAMTEVEGTTLRLSSGSGSAIGEVRFEHWTRFVEGLVELEHLVTASGSPLDPEEDLSVVLLQGVADGLDRHSRILYGEKLLSFDKRLKGTLVGIGCKIGLDADGRLLAKEVYPETPAEMGGLVSGDLILRIDAISTTGLSVSAAVDAITGERGTPVALLVERDGEELELGMIRAEIRLPNLSARTLRSGIAYIRIDHFSEQTLANLKQALERFEEEGTMSRGLVLDLRGNTGGSMIQSARVADQFVEEGVLIRTVGREDLSVKGLVSRIQALADEGEPHIPIAVLQDGKTASGAEIVAGALRELQRAVLLGTTSYGKGTVQKIYNLQPDARLKLTVARYLLPGDLSIDETGLVPDLAVGRTILDTRGVRLRGARPDTPATSFLTTVDERTGWREGEIPEQPADALLEIATRTLDATKGVDRTAALKALSIIGENVVAEEDARLVDAFAVRGIDWSPAVESGISMDVRVDLSSPDPLESGQEGELVASVTNLGQETLHRVAVRLESEDGVLRNRWLPVGRLAPGESAEGQIRFSVPAGRQARESLVRPLVESHLRPDLMVASTTVGIAAAPPPPLILTMELARDPISEGDWLAQVEIENRGEGRLEGLRIRFSYPETSAVELLQYDAPMNDLGPGERDAVDLGLRLLGRDRVVDLVVHVESAGFGELVQWPVSLPVEEGFPVTLEAPEVELVALPLRAPAGELALEVHAVDDRQIESIVVWTSTEKVAYVPVRSNRHVLRVGVPIEVGSNAYTVITTDDQGLVTTGRWYVRGEELPTTSDAAE